MLSKFFRAGAIIFIASAIVNILTLVVHFTISRQLGIDLYGALYSIITIASFVTVLGGIFAMIIARLVAQCKFRSEHRQLQRIVGSSIKYGLVGSCTVTLMLMAAIVPISRYVRIDDLWVVVLLALFSGSQILLSGPRGVLQGLERYSELATSLVLEAALRTLFAVAAIPFHVTVRTVIGAYSVGSIISVVYTVRAALHSCGGADYTGSGLTLASIMRLSVGVLVSTVALGLLGITDVVMVRHFFSNAESSVYGAVALVGKTVFFSVSFLPTIMLPKGVSSSMTAESPWRFLAPAATLIAAITAVALTAFYFQPVFVVRAMVGNHFTNATKYVFIYGIAMAMLGSSNCFVAYRIGTGSFGYIPPLLGLVLIEISTIALWHSSLLQIIAIVTVTNASVLATVLIGISKPQRFAVDDPILVAENLDLH